MKDITTLRANFELLKTWKATKLREKEEEKKKKKYIKTGSK